MNAFVSQERARIWPVTFVTGPNKHQAEIKQTRKDDKGVKQNGLDLHRSC